MDESVINGANLFFAPQFGIDPNATDGNEGNNQWLLGLVNSAPYVRHPPPYAFAHLIVSQSSVALSWDAG